MRQHLTIFLNGERLEINSEHAFMMLADFLRYERMLCGTKIVCAEGDCGACTVLLSRNGDNFVPINACIAMMAQLDGCHIVTVEALKVDDKLSPVQQAIVDHHGTQCGYCTPGFVMAMTGMFEKPCAQLTEQKIKNCLTGNLCRCTGYQPLIEAALAVDPSSITPLKNRFKAHAIDDEFTVPPYHLVTKTNEFFSPNNLKDAIDYREKNPDARIIAGASDLGVMLNKGRVTGGKFLSVQKIPELKTMSELDGRIVIGASVCLSDVRDFVKTRVRVFADFLNIFASPQIKNMATLAGNVANGSPIADTIPFLMVTDGKVHVRGVDGEREILVAELYTGYKKLALRPSEIITHISFAKPSSTEIVRLEKISQRRDLDIATVNLALHFDMENNRVKHARIAIGGIAASVVRMRSVENFLQGQELSLDRIEHAADMIDKDISPLSDLRGSAEYRRKVIGKLFRRYCHGVLSHEA